MNKNTSKIYYKASLEVETNVIIVIRLYRSPNLPNIQDNDLE